MARMNTSKATMLVAALIGTSCCWAMQQGNPQSKPYQATIETFFLPESQPDVYLRLNSFLDSAQNKILIAMYWLTDEAIIGKLIELKERHKDVQIILDETTMDKSQHTLDELVNLFLSKDIVPIISLTGAGIMHNKFVVIDGKSVWTGSPNFTKTVLNSDPEGKYLNNENIVIISSIIAAEQYSKAFFSMKQNIIKVYLVFLEQEDPRNIPDWLIKICQRLYEKDWQFQGSFNQLMSHLPAVQKEKILPYFPSYQPQSPVYYQPASVRQSQAPAYQAPAHQPQAPTYSPQARFYQPPAIEEQLFVPQQIVSGEEEPTDRQKAFLLNHGINPDMSKQLATEIIGEIMTSERSKGRYHPYK